MIRLCNITQAAMTFHIRSFDQVRLGIRQEQIELATHQIDGISQIVPLAIVVAIDHKLYPSTSFWNTFEHCSTLMLLCDPAIPKKACIWRANVHV
jgi:hypothetical protein